MNKNIHFLVPENFKGATFIGNSEGKPVFLMVKAGFCGHCKKMEPAFQAVADQMDNQIFFAAIRADNGSAGEAELAKNIKTILPTFRGFPHMALFVNGKLVDDQPKGRSKEELTSFLKKYVK